LVSALPCATRRSTLPGRSSSGMIRRLSVTLAAFALGLLSFIPIALADVVVSQPDSSQAMSNGSSLPINQRLGNNLSGYVTDITYTTGTKAGASNETIDASIQSCTSSAYTSCTEIASSTHVVALPVSYTSPAGVAPTNAPTTTFQAFQTFRTPALLVAGTYYQIHFSGTSYGELYGSPSTAAYSGGDCYDPGFPTTCVGVNRIGDVAFSLLRNLGGATGSWGAISTSTITSSGFTANCSGTSNIFTEGLCYAGSYLFIPSTTSMQIFSDLHTQMASTSPFSYVFQIQYLYNSLAASSSNTFVDWEIDLSGASSSAAWGGASLIPDKLVILSTSTVMQYMTQSQLDTFKTLIAMAIWMIALTYSYSMLRGFFRELP